MERKASEKCTAYMASSNKKDKPNLPELVLEKEAADFPRFILTESLEEVTRAKFSPFLVEKINSNFYSENFKKTRNGNLLVEVDSWRQAESISEMKTFHTTKCRTYLNEKLNTSRGVIGSRELASATEEEKTGSYNY